MAAVFVCAADKFVIPLGVWRFYALGLPIDFHGGQLKKRAATGGDDDARKTRERMEH